MQTGACPGRHPLNTPRYAFSNLQPVANGPQLWHLTTQQPGYSPNPLGTNCGCRLLRSHMLCSRRTEKGPLAMNTSGTNDQLCVTQVKTAAACIHHHPASGDRLPLPRVPLGVNYSDPLSGYHTIIPTCRTDVGHAI